MDRAARVLVLALDIGSSSTRSALFDDRGRPVVRTASQRKYSLVYGRDGSAELSARRLGNAVRACVRETLRQASAKSSIVGVGVSAFWHALLGLDQKGRPLTPVYTWADSRAAADAARLRDLFDERRIHADTGCMLRASFWPAKLQWLRRTNRELFRKVRRWVSPADWICGEIFGSVGTSLSTASATGLYDQRANTWHDELCRACAVSTAKLAELRESAAGSQAAFAKLRGAQLFTAIGDGAAGNLGSEAMAPPCFAINVGTSAAVRIIAQGRALAPFGLFRYALDDERVVVGGAVSNAGNLRQWCLRELRLSERESISLRRSPAAGDDLSILPFWVGERAPTWPADLGGAVVGLTQSTDAAAIFRAATCATYYRLADILELLEKNYGRARQIVVSGGIVRSKASLRILADALGRDICVSPHAEASLRGAAIYALQKLGYDPELDRRPRLIRHDRALARQHRVRRERQAALENLLFGRNRKLTGAAESI